MEDFSEKLREILLANGAEVCGFADMSDIAGGGLRYAASVGLPMPRDILRGIERDVTAEYRQWYIDANAVLDRAVNAGAEYLRSLGYQAVPLTTAAVKRSPDNRTELPHKSAAMRAGLGWIGKSALLVTPEYGGALRLSTLLTDAPLRCGQPMDRPRCGECTVCRDVCPYGAIKGRTWAIGTDRDELVDAKKCSEGSLARCRELLGVDMTICGKCFVFCPYTRKYARG